jgi:hypothetical protein
MKTKENNCIEIMAKLYRALTDALKSSRADVPRRWLKKRKLSFERTGAGFCSGQIHGKKPKQSAEDMFGIGFLKPSPVKNGSGKQTYVSFGKQSMIFPLRNATSHVVNFYAIGVKDEKTEYLNEDGIYPGHPNENTKRLFITSGILDAATLIESNQMKEGDSVMALFEGEYKPQHREVLKRLAGRAEMIFIRNENAKQKVK